MKKPVIVIAASLLLTACSQDKAPLADSDSEQKYKNARIDVDDSVYNITGEVTAQANTVTRQVEPARGSFSGSQYGASGSFFGPVEQGKGFIRLKVSAATPPTSLAKPGDLTILKVSDTKGTALLPGDVVTFRCRRQYESIAAVRDNSSFDKAKVATWELDFCRLSSPVVDVK